MLALGIALFALAVLLDAVLAARRTRKALTGLMRPPARVVRLELPRCRSARLGKERS